LSFKSFKSYKIYKSQTGIRNVSVRRDHPTSRFDAVSYLPGHRGFRPRQSITLRGRRGPVNRNRYGRRNQRAAG